MLWSSRLLLCIFVVLNFWVLGGNARADQILIDRAVLIADGVEREVSLPHRLDRSDFAAQGSTVIYRLTFDIPDPVDGLLGIYIAKLSLSGRLIRNGQPIWACGDEDLSELRCLHWPHLVQLPAGFLEPGRHVLEFEIFADSRQMNGLTQIVVGPYGQLLHQHYLPSRFLKINLFRMLAIFAFVAGLLSLAAGFAAQRERVFLVFAAAAIFESLSSFTVLVIDPVFDRPMSSWLVFSIRYIAVLLKLLLFHEAFGRLRLRDPIVAFIVLLMAIGPLAFAVTDSNHTVVVALYFFVLGGVLATLVRTIRWTYLAPNMHNKMWTAAAVVIFLTGLHDYARLAGAAAFDGVYLLNFVFPVLIMIMGTTLFVQMGKGLRVARNFTLSLSKEVADRTAELQSALVSIRSMEASALSLTRNIPIGTFILQTWGLERACYTFFSDRLRQMINLPPDAEPPLLIRGSSLLHPDDVKPARDILHKAYEDVARFEAEFRIRNAEGDWRWLRCIMLPQPGSAAPVVWDGVVIDVTEVREAEERLRVANAGLIEAAADQSRIAERERLLREMHDGFGSQLSSARLAIEQGNLDLGAVGRILLECSQDLRIMVDTLGNEDGDLGNAVADFRYRTDRLLFGNGIGITWDIDIPELTRLPPTTILHILRVLQEAMNNALRHSGARHMTLAIKVAEGQLVARVSDDGRGLQDMTREGRGMANMRKRCREIDASLQVTNTGLGTEVALMMDLSDAC